MGAQDLSAKEPAAGDMMPSEGGKEKSWWQKIWPSDDNK